MSREAWSLKSRIFRRCTNLTSAGVNAGRRRHAGIFARAFCGWGLTDNDLSVMGLKAIEAQGVNRPP